ncbi:MAG: hydrogenase maturation protease [Anaerolineae bacterium]|nr:MAG: hydrogenase maturation protease [Anaerolineae bacterium]
MKVLCIGVGNELRGDDVVGRLAVRLLRYQPLPDTTFIEATGEGAALMEAWAGSDTVFLIDAVSAGQPSGTIYRFLAHSQTLPAQFFSYSTHAFSVAEAVEMARVLGQLPTHFVIYGVEGENFTAGASITPSVEKAVHEVIRQISAEIQALHHS